MTPIYLNIRGGIASFAENWHRDAVTGFLVFLFALPLCLGIAMASGFPPMAGMFGAIIGGLVVSRINGSQLTITGPAAGLATVLFSAVGTLGQGDTRAGYRYTLAAIVLAGSLQILLGLFQAGRIALFFPAAIAHGLLASIGVILIMSQAHVLLGAQPVFVTPWRSLLHLPDSVLHFNPVSLLIGGLGLAILLTWPRLEKRWIGRLPAPLVVILAGIALGKGFDLDQINLYGIFETAVVALPYDPVDIHTPAFLVPALGRLTDSLTWPDFAKVEALVFWQVVISLFLIGSLESLLATTAVDRLDPEKRQSNLNRDITAMGIGNVLAGLIGGMPIVAEIVRSSANIRYGARSGWSNFFHGLLLLLFVSLFPQLVRDVPLASLAALLIYVGYRLISPIAFAGTWEVGLEQRCLFAVTVAGILTTHILTGIALAIGLKLVMLRWQGVSVRVQFRNLFRLAYRINGESSGIYRIQINGAAVFSNFAALKSELAKLPVGRKVIFDLRYARLIDHTVMAFIDQYQRDYIALGGQCEIRGLDHFESLSDHPLAARRRKRLK